jgi:predicted acetyltransferase
VRFLSLEETKEIVPPLYDSIREVRPGLISRSETWWRLKSFADPPERRGGGTEAFWVAYEEGGEVLGTARYRRRQRWTDWIPDGKTQVLSVLAKTPAAEAGLWKYLIGIDLVSTIEANERPSDEPLYWMLKDARRLQQRPSDSLWIRLTDVPGALASRRYSAPGSFVVEVVDEFCSWNSGRYRLEGGPAGATCTATSESSNITTSAEVLGAAFLGSSRLATLAAAGLVEGDERSIRLADMMFSWMPRPWCHDFF